MMTKAKLYEVTIRLLASNEEAIYEIVRNMGSGGFSPSAVVEDIKELQEDA